MKSHIIINIKVVIMKSNNLHFLGKKLIYVEETNYSIYCKKVYKT